MNKQDVLESMEHMILYRNEGEFCSWPFNGGMWKISDQHLLVGFMNIPCDYTYAGTIHHDRVEMFGRLCAVRTMDGGKTWGAPEELADNIVLSDQLRYGRPASATNGIDTSDPEALLLCWSTPDSGNPEAKAWISLSRNAGHDWDPPALLPACGIPRYQGRPSYVVRKDGVILLFLTARPKTNPLDRPVVFASFDKGINWTLISYMPASQEYRMICPSPVIFEDGTIAVAVRCKPAMDSAWGEIYVSRDGGLSWNFASRINDHGDTVHLSLLEDGRLFAVYGYRRPPFGIRARISEDRGESWGEELIIRDDGGSRDLGYPRAAELSGGRMLISYYMNDKSDPIQLNGGVRYIAGTTLQL